MDRDVRNLVGIFTVSGVLHFVTPQPFENIVPRPLPHKRTLVYASGAAELAAAAMLAHPRTRRLGGMVSFGVLLAVLPANVQMTVSAWRSDRTPAWFTLGTVLRLPLQVPLLRWAWRSART